MRVLILLFLAALIGAAGYVAHEMTDLQARAEALEAAREEHAKDLAGLKQNQESIIHNIATEIRPAKIGPFLEWQATRGEGK